MGQSDAGARIEKAVQYIVKHDLKSLSAGKMGMGTTEVGDRVAKYVAEGKGLS